MPENVAELRRQFDEQMLQIYARARAECSYNAMRFLAMLHEHKGVETARRLLPSMSDGYSELWRRGRLDLTVEALMIREPWCALFSEDELKVARDRLQQSNYAPAAMPMKAPGASAAARAPMPTAAAAPAGPIGGPVVSNLDAIASAFADTFGNVKRFGGPAVGYLGMSDDVSGVQWNISYQVKAAALTIGVNLEGLQYDDWPIARVIERELARPDFCAIARRLERSHELTVVWWRDCWQAAVRVRIQESVIAPTPITLDRLTTETWQQTLDEAYACLDASKGHRGRRRRTVTLAASGAQVERPVSPHLQVRMPLVLDAGFDWGKALRAGQQRLAPVYEWATDRARR